MGGEVLNESLGVIAGSADVARAVGCPGDGIDAGLVPLEFNNRECGEADVEDDNLGTVHDDGGHVSGVLLVPVEADERSVGFGALVEDPDEAVGGDGSKDADATPGDVIDLLVVGDELDARGVGDSGTNGESGAGEPGTVGLVGVEAESGAEGESGDAGVSGADGESGVVGTSGDAGEAGASANYLWIFQNVIITIHRDETSVMDVGSYG
ncbi:hypothetical protein RJ640_022165 [Escallonia rubra]|uniref:Uncharacterized protein n=1 Tax=Escallonia rubra TaxID=112253 RepID=A0AA88RH20_9ASTE|nr:hypothetical protein RJ640_022165 [Escallonia rubra]